MLNCRLYEQETARGRVCDEPELWVERVIQEVREGHLGRAWWLNGCCCLSGRKSEDESHLTTLKSAHAAIPLTATVSDSKIQRAMTTGQRCVLLSLQVKLSVKYRTTSCPELVIVNDVLLDSALAHVRAKYPLLALSFDDLVPKYRAQPLAGEAYDEGDAGKRGAGMG